METIIRQVTMEDYDAFYALWDSTEQTQPSGGCSEKKLWGIILTETGQKEILPSGLGAGWSSYGKGAQQ